MRTERTRLGRSMADVLLRTMSGAAHRKEAWYAESSAGSALAAAGPAKRVLGARSDTPRGQSSDAASTLRSAAGVPGRNFHRDETRRQLQASVWNCGRFFHIFFS
ncbi:hypothetical protein L1887_63374 [Cichorium endivia]|nr:hypothetical protein L1887_63374 [Cichorium endivia]